jgi:hypothetical protein
MLSETDGDLVNSAGKINNRFKTSRSEVSGDFLPFFVLCPGKFFLLQLSSDFWSSWFLRGQIKCF